MSTVHLELDVQLAQQLQRLGRPLGDLVPELLVLELYRRASISSGKAAELLGMDRFAFVQYASRLGIPFFDMTEDEFRAELDALREL